MKDINWFLSICDANGMNLTSTQAAEFENYRRALLSVNKNVNLISRKDEENFYPNHALNSISFLFRRELKPDARLIDLGTGGGLPGVPIRIIYDNMGVLFVDSISKKTVALSTILTELGWKGSRAVNGRAEELAKKSEFQGRFDYVVSRAAGKLDEVVTWSRGFLRSFEKTFDDRIPVGTLIVLKGGRFEDELRRARGLKFVDSVEVTDTTFQGMQEIYNKEKKLVVVKYKEAQSGRRN